jgi:hypothetical protein
MLSAGTFQELCFEFKKGLFHFLVAREVDEVEEDLFARLLLVVVPVLFLPEEEGEFLSGREGTWRWVDAERAVRW